MSAVRILRVKILLSLLCLPSAGRAMVFDNRFLPLYPPLRLHRGQLPASWTLNAIIGTAGVAIDDTDSQKEIGIPEIFGRLDEGSLGTAAELVGKKNPLRTEWSGQSIPLRINGKQQIEGISLSAFQPLYDCFFVSLSCLFMRVNSRHEFFIRDKSDTVGAENFGSELNADQRVQLDVARRKLFSELSLRENHAPQIGMSDLDIAFGVRHAWDFACKFRRIDVDMRVGMIAPTGIRHDLDVPGSIPFGGDGFWGVYFDAQALFELKEDMKFGLLGRVIKRLPKTSLERISVAGEPVIFGATVGSVYRNPGVTVVFSPFIALEHLRNGFGLSLSYTLVHHRPDSVADRRPPIEQTAVKANIDALVDYSSWTSDYLTLAAFYEIDWLCEREKLIPTVSFRWDIPATLLAGGRMVKTHLLSGGIEIAF